MCTSMAKWPCSWPSGHAFHVSSLGFPCVTYSEPIVGNEVVYTSIRLPPQLDDEDEIVEHKIVPSFDFDKTHHVSEMDHYNEEETPVANVSP